MAHAFSTLPTTYTVCSVFCRSSLVPWELSGCVAMLVPQKGDIPIDCFEVLHMSCIWRHIQVWFFRYASTPLARGAPEFQKGIRSSVASDRNDRVPAPLS